MLFFFLEIWRYLLCNTYIWTVSYIYIIYKIQYEQYMIISYVYISLYIYIYSYLLHVCPIFSGETSCLVFCRWLHCCPRMPDQWRLRRLRNVPVFFGKTRFFFWGGDTTQMIIFKALPIFCGFFGIWNLYEYPCSLRLNFTSFTRDRNHICNQSTSNHQAHHFMFNDSNYKLMATWTPQAVHLVEFGELSVCDWKCSWF